MTEWWNTLSLAQQIFYGIALISSLILLVQVVLGLIGLDHDVGFDASTEHGSGLGVLSVQSIATFFLGFGWVGALWLSRGFGLWIAVFSGLVVGIALMAAVIFLMRSVLRLQDSGTLDYHNAVGLSATVYCGVPASRQPGGQVEVLLQGRIVFADALTDSVEALKPGAPVRVVSIIAPSTLIVEPA